MAYKINSTTIIDDSRQVISTSTITATSFSGKGTIPAGATVVFNQANAPTGFTKITLYNDYTLRVVSGTGGATGGAVDFTTAFPPAANTTIPVTATVNNLTLTTPQIASHNHPGGGYAPGNDAGPSSPGDRNTVTGPTGGDNTHTHPAPAASTSINVRVKYVDVILATRDA
jgi:hypothetical protein